MGTKYALLTVFSDHKFLKPEYFPDDFSRLAIVKNNVVNFWIQILVQKL